MIDRYTRPEMKKLWSDETRYQCWLAVEIAADEAWSKLGKIPAEDVKKLSRMPSSPLKASKKSKPLRTMT